MGNRSTWNAGFGMCDTYDVSNTLGNYHFCEFDCVGGECASQVCQECGKCATQGTFNTSLHRNILPYYM